MLSRIRVGCFLMYEELSFSDDNFMRYDEINLFLLEVYFTRISLRYLKFCSDSLAVLQFCEFQLSLSTWKERLTGSWIIALLLNCFCAHLLYIRYRNTLQVFDYHMRDENLCTRQPHEWLGESNNTTKSAMKQIRKKKIKKKWQLMLKSDQLKTVEGTQTGKPCLNMIKSP